MESQDYSGICDWVFDLDNTLYPPSARILDQVKVRMDDFIMRNLQLDIEDAEALNRRYHARHGSLLAGLMQNHQVPPEPYLTEIHDVDLTNVPTNTHLGQAIANLPGRALVFTNGSRRHAFRLLDALGLTNVVDRVLAIEDVEFHPKPQASAYDVFLEKSGVDAQKCAYFDDNEENLTYPMSLGMKTIWVNTNAPASSSPHDRTNNLTDYLKRLF